MSSSAVQGFEKGQEPGAAVQPANAGGLEILLHALNQPLTGLQCSMEVALAHPRSNEEYVQRMRESLELTERMRILVGAIRELVNADENQAIGQEAIDLQNILREVAEELAPVAETKGVHISLDREESAPLMVRAERRMIGRTVFRLLESALSLADGGSSLRIKLGRGDEDNGARISVCWSAMAMPASFRPELGLLIARAGWERSGARWKRERAGNLEMVSIHLPVSTMVNPF